MSPLPRDPSWPHSTVRAYWSESFVLTLRVWLCGIAVSLLTWVNLCWWFHCPVFTADGIRCSLGTDADAADISCHHTAPGHAGTHGSCWLMYVLLVPRPWEGGGVAATDGPCAAFNNLLWEKMRCEQSVLSFQKAVFSTPFGLLWDWQETTMRK